MRDQDDRVINGDLNGDYNLPGHLLPAGLSGAHRLRRGGGRHLRHLA